MLLSWGVFLAGTCVFWMDVGQPIRWFLHRSCLSVDNCPLWVWKKKKISTSQKPCRNSERHNHHRYQIHQILYVYIFHFHGGEGGCTNWDVTWGGNPKCFEAAVILGHDVKHVKLPRHSTLSFKRLYCRTTLLITIWENTSMFYCIFIVHFFFFFKYINYMSTASFCHYPHPTSAIGSTQWVPTPSPASFEWPCLLKPHIAIITHNIPKHVSFLHFIADKGQKIKVNEICSIRGICGDLACTHNPPVISHH